MEDRVRIKLPRLRDGKDEDVPVCLNGKWYLIKRGAEVLVPRGVAEIIANTDAAAEIAEVYAEKAARKVKEADK